MILKIKSKNKEAEEKLKQLGLRTWIMLRGAGIKVKKIDNTEVHMLYNQKQTEMLKQVPQDKLKEYIIKQLNQMEIKEKDFEIEMI